MALLQSTLASEIESALASLSSASAPTAENTHATTFGSYFKDAYHNGVPVIASAVDSIAVPAMVAAMVFSAGSPAEGAAQLAAGYSAFWAAIVAAPVSFWPASGVVTPPAGLASLAGSFVSVFSTNNDPSISITDAAGNMAAILHPDAGLGGTALIGAGPAFAPII